MKAFLHTLRIFTGLIFIASAVLKILSIDGFEIYVYSLGFLNLDLSFIFARLLISAELFLGLMLIIGQKFRFTWLITFLLIIVFSIFLILQIIQGKQGNCFCFGEAISLSPAESLVKNIIIIILLLAIRKLKPTTFRFSIVFVTVIAAASLAIPSLISPPDFMIREQFTSYDEFSTEAVSAEIKRDIYEPVAAAEGKKIVCFFNTKCEYCKLSAAKLTAASHKMDLQDHVIYIFFGKKESLDEFWEDSRSTHFSNHIISIQDFFRASGPNLPAIYFVENGEVKQKYGYRTLDEKSIREFIEE